MSTYPSPTNDFDADGFRIGAFDANGHRIDPYEDRTGLGYVPTHLDGIAPEPEPAEQHGPWCDEAPASEACATCRLLPCSNCGEDFDTTAPPADCPAGGGKPCINYLAAVTR